MDEDTGSPKASPRNSPFTSPRSSNQWCRPAVDSPHLAAQRGHGVAPFIVDTVVEASEEEKVPADDDDLQAAAAAAAAAAASQPGQHLTIPAKEALESSSSAETLTGASARRTVGPFCLSLPP